MSLLTLTDIGLELGGRSILDRVSLTVSRGEIVTVIGPNGAGKSSLLRVALGLLAPSRGQRRLEAGIRIGYMPQQLSLDSTLPLSAGRFLRLARAGVSGTEIRVALAETGVAELIDRPLSRLSGGELQRVLLARALLRQPDLLVLDEPAQGVDVGGQEELYRLIQRLRDRHHCGVLLVSHDLHLVMAATDRVLCLNRHVCCSGHPESVSAHPEYLALFGARGGAGIAVYSHHHDHQHDCHGDVVNGQTVTTQGGHRHDAERGSGRA